MINANLIHYTIKSTLWFILIMLIENNFAKNHLWFVILSIFVLSIPIALGGIYTNTISLIDRLTSFSKKGFIYKIRSKRSIKVFFWILWSLGSSFYIFIQFHTYTIVDWFTFLLVIPIFAFVFIKWKKINKKERTPYIHLSESLKYTRYTVPIIMLFIYGVLSYIFMEKIEYGTLEEAITIKENTVSDISSSILLREVSLYLATYSGIVTYALSKLDGISINTIIAMVIISIGNFTIFYNAGTILSCFLIPRTEFRRIFGPLTKDTIPKKVSNSRIAGITVMTTFISLFIYLPLYTSIENLIVRSPKIETGRQDALNVLYKAEKIGKNWYNPGTREDIEKKNLEAILALKSDLFKLEYKIDQAYLGMEPNVDKYLDWYYSLAGEYGRISRMLINDLDAYMVEKLKEHLQQGDVFSEIETYVASSQEQINQIELTLNKSIQEILDNNRIFPTDSLKDEVTESIDINTLLIFNEHQDLINLDNRLITSGSLGMGSGVMSTIIIKNIIKKTTSKGVMKGAAIALSKVLLSKTASTAGGTTIGTAIGGAIGSVIPGAGTAAGAVIGGIVGGMLTGFTVDKLVLEIEEEMSREKFKYDIILTIQEAKEEFKSDYLEPYSIWRDN